VSGEESGRPCGSYLVPITALCCFTPLLVWGLTAIGVAAVIAYLDFVLIPLLLVFAGVVMIGVQQYRKQRSGQEAK
jgi:mercuric ion transport protein